MVQVKFRPTCLDLPYPRVGFYTLCDEMLKFEVLSMMYEECRMKLKYGYEVCRMKLEVSNNACSKILEDSPFNIDHAAIGVVPILC